MLAFIYVKIFYIIHKGLFYSAKKHFLIKDILYKTLKTTVHNSDLQSLKFKK